jgi:3-methyl-2-oxobutanoate hydroxymethyltransferase
MQGKTKGQAEALVADAEALEQAGVFAMVLECIPSGVAKVITESVQATTIGCGAGPHTDGQNLNAYDLLGLFDRFVPKFVKQYKRLAQEITESFSALADEVRAGAFPGPEHTFTGGKEVSRLFPG